jgi:hypothetical protein
MVCHSTDPENVEYGGDKKVTPGHERPCAGALILLIKHVNEANDAPSVKEYQKRHPLPMSKAGLATVVGNALFGEIPAVEDRADEVSLPWENDKEKADATNRR